ncbi:unnamed protein product [Rhizoctonia solani]|uniref:Uncharacterized protein n=1 Tax=Rhizoctonia solani TaxID=456999 RepID=A0A8H3DW60_9AGAM|nr:unnamed protein product [Rhizoctonia solani]
MSDNTEMEHVAIVRASNPPSPKAMAAPSSPPSFPISSPSHPSPKTSKALQLRRRGALGYALSPLVQHFGPASRLLVPSTNKMITSLDISLCTQPRFILDFCSEEGRQSVKKWYENQGLHTRFTLLEYRKDKEGQFKHEFIVAWLNNTTLCRFDRRARDGERGNALCDEGALAEDSAHVLSTFETEYKQLLEQTEVLVSVKLPRGEDLGTILAVCEGIQTHAKASAYNLMRYNCYFFSWMIISAIARRTCNWDTVALQLSEESWHNIVQTSLAHSFQALEPGPVATRWTKSLPRLSNIFTKTYERLQSKTTILPTAPDVRRFQIQLKSNYRDVLGIVMQVLSKLLLRTQVGSTLEKELRRVSSEPVFLAKCAAAEESAVVSILESAHRILVRTIHGNVFLLQWKQALAGLHSNISPIVEIASANAARRLVDEPLEDLWKSSWAETWEAKQYTSDVPSPGLFSHLRCRDAEDVLKKEWNAIGSRAMSEWKLTWDEWDRLGARYIMIATEALTAEVLMLLTDIPPEHLTFGDSLKLDSAPSLQELIRGRMEEHFETVDRFGFGSFQELITSTEEAMCEIWVASLDIIQSNRYSPQHAATTSTTA